MLNNENVWGKAMNRVLNEKMPVDKAVDEMIARGLIDEVRSLKDRYGCEVESMTGIGYRQICRFLSGEQKLSEAIDEVKKDTHHYAKRQMTWFKRDGRIVWVTPDQSVESLIQDFLKS